MCLLGNRKGRCIDGHIHIESTTLIDRDILKLAVIERHLRTGHIGLGFISGIGMKNWAFYDDGVCEPACYSFS